MVQILFSVDMIREDLEDFLQGTSLRKSRFDAISLTEINKLKILKDSYDNIHRFLSEF